MACVTVKQLQKPSAEGRGCGGLTGGSIGTAPIWRRPDEILSIAHVLRDHVVLIQPSDPQYDNIHGLRNGKTVTKTVRGGVWGTYRRFYRYRAHMASTGRDLKHRTRSQGPCGAQTAVRSTVRQYTWPMCNRVKQLLYLRPVKDYQLLASHT